MSTLSLKNNKSACWVPTLYFAEGIPYTVVMNLTTIIFFQVLGLSTQDTTMYLGWLNIPWLIKPLWSPLIQLIKTSRFWIIACQIFMGALIACFGLTIPIENSFKYIIIILFLCAFSSATHDIAADGFYIDNLSQKEQSFWVGIRNTCYRIAMVVAQGGIVLLASKLELFTNDKYMAWAYALIIIGVLLSLIGVYHLFVLPKKQKTDNPNDNSSNKSQSIIYYILIGFVLQIKDYIKKDGIGLAISFLLVYRLAEALLLRIGQIFLLDEVNNGGVGLTTEQYGLIYGTIGVIAMIIGGILGGIAIARYGLRKMLFPMLIILNVPDVFYLLISVCNITNIFHIGCMVAIEQFGYGFGFTAFTVYMLHISKGEYATCHYAISTMFMTMGLMLPSMISGYLKDILGYNLFFILVLICSIPSFILAFYVRNDNFVNQTQDERQTDRN
ncbi:MAG: MFS transporter [Bacteroidales bacterium]|nr:MFS transporter [Bacteroidales bacterium]